MALYLAEQYWPDVTRESLGAAVRALFVHRAVSENAARVVAILFMAQDECIFYLVDGASQTAVSELVGRTGRPADRVQRCERLDPFHGELFPGNRNIDADEGPRRPAPSR